MCLEELEEKVKLTASNLTGCSDVCASQLWQMSKASF